MPPSGTAKYTFACVLPMQPSRDLALCFLSGAKKKKISRRNLSQVLPHRDVLWCKTLIRNRNKEIRRIKTSAAVDGGGVEGVVDAFCGVVPSSVIARLVTKEGKRKDVERMRKAKERI